METATLMACFIAANAYDFEIAKSYGRLLRYKAFSVL